ncbi:MAG: LPS export ABC transporter periplasmic protein LptC [Bacteroidaceae bacterium]|nr:LPS export ABC transporter periplasmic protein LptC [Bacteroidaceae bacterium]
MASMFLAACEKQKEHIAPAIYERDSVAMMTSYGVNALISDSGVIKYRIVTERWEYNPSVNPSRSIFEKGVFLTQFDEKFHVQGYIQADTAYNYDKQRLWELRGRVRILTKDGLHFTSEELYWDEGRHEFYSNVFSKLVTPERTLQGTYFRSDDRMTHYYVSNSKGSFEKEDFDKTEEEGNDTLKAQKPQRQMSRPQRKIQ